MQTYFLELFPAQCYILLRLISMQAYILLRIFFSRCYLPYTVEWLGLWKPYLSKTSSNTHLLNPKAEIRGWPAHKIKKLAEREGHVVARVLGRRF